VFVILNLLVKKIFMLLGAHWVSGNTYKICVEQTTLSDLGIYVGRIIKLILEGGSETQISWEMSCCPCHIYWD
jgi:hypothetical protein